MKKCPFCKNEIETEATQCPKCQRVLVEKVFSVKHAPESFYAQSSSKGTKEKTYNYYTPPEKSSLPKKGFHLPRHSGLIASILGFIALIAILSNSNTPSSTLPTPASTTSTDSQQIPTVSVSQTPYNFLPNGTVLFSSRAFSGSGILTISNASGGSDAIVKLITNGGVKVYSVYIRANNSYSIKKINDGVYRVLFSFGSDWDTNQKKFLVNPSAESFDDTFDFETTETQYTTYSITLNPVVGGKATTSSLTPNDFDKY